MFKAFICRLIFRRRNRAIVNHINNVLLARRLGSFHA